MVWPRRGAGNVRPVEALETLDDGEHDDTTGPRATPARGNAAGGTAATVDATAPNVETLERKARR